MKVPDLATIKRQAERNHYDLDNIPWEQGVDHGKWFYPEHISPLFHTPSYAKLTLDEQKTYNQIYAQAINEQFIFLEDVFLVRFLGDLSARLKKKLPADLQEAIANFVEEEVKHTEMFRKLARVTAPGRYMDTDYHFLRLRGTEKRALAFMAKHPDKFVFWTWLALAFEEKTVDYYRQYVHHQKSTPEHELDPLYFAVHKAHMMDEVRHVQVDHHLIHYFYDQCGPMLKAFNVKLVFRMLKSYLTPKRTQVRVLDELVHRCPRLKPLRNDMVHQVKNSPTWQPATYARKNAPQTFALFDAYPEFHELQRFAQCYEPQEVSPYLVG
ncbi:diiron oxygenase [Planctomycetota bacterium]|nr:diiron oxygenase [Planctomycetota bacterium]